MRRALPAYAIVRVDRDVRDDEERVRVKRVVWDEDAARYEVARLNELNGDKDCFYFVQYTRVDPPTDG